MRSSISFVTGTRTLPVLSAFILMAGVAACDARAFTLTGPGASVPRGATIFGVDDRNTLVSFGRGNPTRGEVLRIPITGLGTSETVVGIDFRANAPGVSDRRLYAITSGNRVVTVDTTTGAATIIGTAAFTPALTGTSFGVDFNPQADRIRLHSDAEQNLRLNPLTGVVAATDTALAYADGDVNAGQNPTIVGTAYTNSVPGATATDLFAIDADRDALVLLESPNSGKLTTRGTLGVNTTLAVGFDIVGAGAGTSFVGTAYATLTGNPTRSQLYTINLATGLASLIGDVAHDRPLIGIAIAP